MIKSSINNHLNLSILSQNKTKFTPEEKVVLAASMPSTTEVLTLTDILGNADENEDGKTAALKAMRQTAEFGRYVVTNHTIITMKGKSRMRDDRTMEFPVVFGGQRAIRMWTHWFMAALTICDSPSMVTGAVNKKAWAKASWLSASESLGSVIAQFKCVEFEPKLDAAGREVLPPHCFDNVKLKKLLSNEDDLDLFLKQYDDFDDPNLAAEIQGQRGRIKRAGLINRIRATYEYAQYLEEQFLEPGKAKTRGLNAKGLAYVQGIVRIDPYFTEEQLKIVNP